METSPFDLRNDDAYSRWKENKLKNYPTKLEDLQVEVNDNLPLLSNSNGTLNAMLMQ